MHIRLRVKIYGFKRSRLSIEHIKFSTGKGCIKVLKITHRYFKLVSSLNASGGTPDSLFLSRYLRMKSVVCVVKLITARQNAKALTGRWFRSILQEKK